MRRFHDAGGVEWTVVLGRASYGEITLLFSRADSIEVFGTPLEADSSAVGRDFLIELAEEELRARLADARPWHEMYS